ncbi:neprilysin-1-like [Rhipicephalus microplus]|uniref:neprilysin-1-like n=1 Tax=Rhipicephalus microplus TaxID=6941 RepID=UPI003F6B7B13
MLSLNLDFLNETRMAAVDPFDIIVRGSLNLGVNAIVSIFFDRDQFLDGKRAMKLSLSEEESKSLRWRFKQPESSNLRHYERYLSLFGANPKQDKELALKLFGYERALHHLVVNGRYGLLWETLQIGRMGGHTARAVSSVQWTTCISKYTNGTYTGSDKIHHDIAASQLVKKLFYHRDVRKDGLRYLVAWSFYRQLVNFTDPYRFLGHKTAENACYDHIRNVMDLAITSHYFQSLVTPRMAYLSKRMASRIRSAFEKALQASSYLTADIRAHLINKLLNHTIFIGSPGRRLDPDFVEDIYKLLPDAPLDWLFPTWIKARGLEYQYYWRDTTSTLYEEEYVGGYNNPLIGGVVIPIGTFIRPFIYEYGPLGLNYGGIGWVIGHELMHSFNDYAVQNTPGMTAEVFAEYTRRGLCYRRSIQSVLSLIGIDDQLVDSIDTENLCDLEGTKFAYAAFASLPQKYRDVKLVGLNMTSEQLYFVSHCLTMCSSASTSKRTALLAQSRYAPAWKRCMVPLRNMPEFSRAFGCAEGTVMNPTEKCSVW